MVTPSELGESRDRRRGSHEAHVPDFPSLIPERVVALCRTLGRALVAVLEIAARLLLMRATPTHLERKWPIDPGAARGYQEWLRAKRESSRGRVEND